MQTSTLKSCGAFSTRRPARPATRQPRRASARVVAALDAQAIQAATQQAVAFVTCVGAEAAFTGLTTPSSNAGRPSIVPTLGGIGGTLVAAALIRQTGVLAAAGSVLGFASAAGMLAIYATRARDTPYPDLSEWPGPKAWPAGMALISFFELAVFAQLLGPSLG